MVGSLFKSRTLLTNLSSKAIASMSGYMRLSTSTSHSLASKFTDVSEVKALWKRANAVCFDVDSTVIDGEGIDELADFCGKGKEVAEWTKKAMTGNVPFHVGNFVEIDLSILMYMFDSFRGEIEVNSAEFEPS